MSDKTVALRPKPENMISATVIKEVLFLLVNETTIAVYDMNERTEWNGHYDVAVDNQMYKIHLQDLGLTTNCELQKIWAGDRESATYMLHVLYQKGQDKILVSYSVNKNFLEKCEN